MKTGSQLTGNIQEYSTGYLQVAVGNTAQRPGTANNGMLRYNNQTQTFEFYQANVWTNLGVLSEVANSNVVGAEGISVTTTNGVASVGLNITSLTTQTTVGTSDYVAFANSAGGANYKTTVLSLGTALTNLASATFVNISGDTMTGPLTIASGNVTMDSGNFVIASGQAQLPNGSYGVPTYSFSNQLDGGLFALSSTAVALTNGGNTTNNALIVQANTAIGSFILSASDSVIFPTGNTTQRPTAPLAGTMRFNNLLHGWDVSNGTNWATYTFSSLTGYDNVVSEEMPFVWDTTRSKFLSAQHMHVQYQSLSVTSNAFVYPSNLAYSSDVGTIMPYNGTITGFTVYVSDINKCIRSVTVYTGPASASVANLSVFTFGNTSSTSAYYVSQTNINLNFAAGDNIRIQLPFSSGTSGNPWTNMNLVMYYKWRI